MVIFCSLYNPDAGDPIRGMAGLRKIRMALPGRGNPSDALANPQFGACSA